MGKLTSIFVQKTKESGRYGDGGGLYLQISDKAHKSWIFRFMKNQKSREMGLGSLDLVTLAEARLKAAESKKLLLDGVDPIEANRLAREAQTLSEAKAMTFDQCAAAYIESHKPGWKNVKHAEQWTNTLATYAKSIIGHLSIQDVDTGLVTKVLEPIWYTKTETASRVRNRIELIISWATVRGYRTGENPARWRGHLDHLLPKRSSVQKVKHFAALPMNELGDFIQKLHGFEGIVPLALEFQILTASRTNEVMGAKWSEINIDEALWTIPSSRMKAKREHRVPLSARAVDILKSLNSPGNDAYIFPGRYSGQLSSNAFLALIKKRLHLKVTAHGFRSTFSDWASERTIHSREVVEMALAHSIKDATEAAYRRGELLLKRRALMNDWAKFCATCSSEHAKLLVLKPMERTFNEQL